MAKRGVSFDLTAQDIMMTCAVQMSGFLSKKPVGHQSSKWSKRFFVLKDGFLLYYSEAEKKAFDDKKTFNIHPKGVIPLGNCSVEEIALSNVSYALCIQLPDHKTSICVSAENEVERQQWLSAMNLATTTTHENLQVSEAMVKSLQQQNLQLSKERQEYVDKFISEAEELGIEREQKEALEEFNQQLAEEKNRIEMLVEELQNAQDDIKQELEETIKASETLEKERKKITDVAVTLQNSIEELSSERSNIMEQLKAREDQAEKINIEKDELASKLQLELVAIEDRERELVESKAEVEARLLDNELKAENICREKELIHQEASELKQELVELNQEKEETEKDLQEEIIARRQLQRDLEICKQALGRLEDEVLMQKKRNNGSGIDDQVMADVKSLREFFENIAMETKIEIDRSRIMKHRVSRRVTAKRRARSIKPRK